MAKAIKNPLGEFEGRDVLQSTIKVTNAGDGLSKALAIDPVKYNIGDTVHIVLECEVTNVNHQEIDDTDALKRVHTFKAGTAAVIERSKVNKLMNDTRRAIEQASGVEQLPGTEDTTTHGDE